MLTASLFKICELDYQILHHLHFFFIDLLHGLQISILGILANLKILAYFHYYLLLTAISVCQNAYMYNFIFYISFIIIYRHLFDHTHAFLIYYLYKIMYNLY